MVYKSQIRLIAKFVEGLQIYQKKSVNLQICDLWKLYGDCTPLDTANLICTCTLQLAEYLSIWN
jgi:hypothetical protein